MQRKAIRLNIFHVFERFIARPCAYNAWILVCDIWLCLDQGPSYWGGWMRCQCFREVMVSALSLQQYQYISHRRTHD